MIEKNKLLGLDNREIKILSCLETEKNLQQICTDLKIPKSTIADILKRLIKRGLVKKKNFTYELTEEYIKMKSDNELAITDYSKIIVRNGLSEVIKTWGILYSFKNYRCVMYQSNDSVKSFLKKVNIDDIINHNERVKKDGQILEMYVEPGYILTIKNMLAPEKYIEWLKSFQRNFVCFEVRKDVFYSRNDILIFMDNLFFTNNYDETCIQIRQYDTSKAMQDLLRTLQNEAKQIDFNKLLSEEIGRNEIK